MDWPTPKNVKDVRSFMGLAIYYRIFIEGFFKIEYPITSLQRKNLRFIWSKKCEERFQPLKKLLTSSIVFKIVDPEKIL